MLPSLLLSAELLLLFSVLVVATIWVLERGRRHQPAAKPTLEVALQTNLAVLGVATTTAGRTFLVFRRKGTAATPQVGEWQPDGSVRPFPTTDWNQLVSDSNAPWTFVHANALRVGPGEVLWVLDTGSPAFGAATLPEGPKLVRVDLTTNRVVRIYPLGSVAGGTAYLNDVRFNGRHAYLTDSGRPALVVLDLTSGQARRVLENHPSLVAYRPYLANGQLLRTPQQTPVLVHADALELSPDGRWLYFAPATGPMFKIDTRCLNDDQLSEAARGRQVRFFADTPSTGGTAMDATGRLYFSDKAKPGILCLTPDGRLRDVVRDERLDFVDALWIADNGDLLAPAAQLGRTAALNGGLEATNPPFTIYRLRLGLQPVRH